MIKKLEEATSSKGNQMLVIYYDTADEDIQPHYYMDRYLADDYHETKLVQIARDDVKPRLVLTR